MKILALQNRVITAPKVPTLSVNKNRKNDLILKRTFVVRASEDPQDNNPIEEKSESAPENANAEEQKATPSVDPTAVVAKNEKDLQLPQSVIAKLRDTVFGLDTLFVTSVENYGASGVLFKGNLRGNPAAAHKKLVSRLNDQLGEGYRLFLLTDQDDNPVAVVIPASSAEFQSASPIAELSLAILLGATTIATTFNIFGAELFDAALLSAQFDSALVTEAVPGVLATFAILLASEIAHYIGAKKVNVELAPPILIPAGLGLLGSFGAITRIRSSVSNRIALATVAAPGPLAGSAVALVIMLTGLVLTLTGNGGVEVDSASFRESLLIGSLAQSVFGERVFTAEAVSCNPLFVAGWAGLIINSINSLPAGELDGGKVFLALFGRGAASRMSVLTFFLLGVFGFGSSLSLYTLLLVLTLQRGPVVPCDEELTPLPPGGALKIASLLMLILPLLVLLPFPFYAPDLTEGLSAVPPEF